MDANQSAEAQRRRKTDLREQSGRSLRIRTLNIVLVAAAVVLSVLALVTVQRVLATNEQGAAASEEYRLCERAADDFQIASDYLTTQSRMYVITGDVEYLDNYLLEFEVADRRGRAVEAMTERLADGQALDLVERAMGQSAELSGDELYAMRLRAEAGGLASLPAALAGVELSAADAALDADGMREAAQAIVVGDAYREQKAAIDGTVAECAQTLIDNAASVQQEATARHRGLLVALQVITVLLLVLVVASIAANTVLILWPIGSYIQHIHANEPLVSRGAYEMRYLADAYNVMFEENRIRTSALKHAAEHDPLTGLYNRGAYDALLQEHTERVALLLVDVDKFKNFNDDYGHDTGDQVLKKVADALAGTFRSTDFPCRIGGDEFAVIMTDVDPGLRAVISAKIEQVAAILVDTADGLPPVTLSIGVAFAAGPMGEDEIYKAADSALYVVKERGRNGHAFYGDPA